MEVVSLAWDLDVAVHVMEIIFFIFQVKSQVVKDAM